MAVCVHALMGLESVVFEFQRGVHLSEIRLMYCHVL